jgi:hypothetical protein
MMELHPHAGALTYAEAEARRRLGVPPERDLAHLARRERALAAPSRGPKAAVARSLPTAARRLHTLAGALDPTLGA